LIWSNDEEKEADDRKTENDADAEDANTVNTIEISGAWWLIRRFVAFRPKGHRLRIPL